MPPCHGHDHKHGRWLLALGLMLGAGLAWAQSPADAVIDGDPPARVARLAYIAGDVGFLPAGAEDWRGVSVNRPLVSGDRLSTGSDARVELDLGNASLRLDNSTDFGFLDLDDWQVQAELTQGTADLNVRRIPDGQDFEIDTPTLAVVVDRPAQVRVDVAADGASTRVSVSSGSAVAYGDDGARRVLEEGMRYRFADSALSIVQAEPIDGGDTFDFWVRERELRYVASASRQYVPAGTIGYQDLDSHGEWRSEPAYGEVWFPSDVGAGWAPYRNGHWAWIAPWGWTWVDDAAWGFAPFHYGRWSMIGGRWGWIPGPAGLRAVYAPALVTFFGGSGWSVSLGIGSRPVGWFPLGPGMVYSPWYHASRHYYARINRSNLCARDRDQRRRVDRRIDGGYNAWSKPERLRKVHYVGQRPPRGITVVSGHALAEGRHVRAARLNVEPARLRRAPVLHHGVQVRPDHRARAAAKPLRRQSLPLHGFKRTVVARDPPRLRPAVVHQPQAKAAAAQAKPVLRPPLPHVRLLRGHSRGAEVQRPRPAEKIYAGAHRWHAQAARQPARRPPAVKAATVRPATVKPVAKPAAGLPHVPRLRVAPPRSYSASSSRAVTVPRDHARRAQRPTTHVSATAPRRWTRAPRSLATPSRATPRHAQPRHASPRQPVRVPQRSLPSSHRVHSAPSRAPVRRYAAPSPRPATKAPARRATSHASPRTSAKKPVRWDNDKR